MSSPKAILLGSILIAASIMVVNTIHPARAAMGGPYQLMHHTNPNANAGVFRLDTSSGSVSYCFVSGEAQLVCSAEVK
jgi:hypothetical protein